MKDEPFDAPNDYVSKISMMDLKNMKDVMGPSLYKGFVCMTLRPVLASQSKTLLRDLLLPMDTGDVHDVLRYRLPDPKEKSETALRVAVVNEDMLSITTLLRQVVLKPVVRLGQMK